MFKKLLLAGFVACAALLPMGVANAQHIEGDINYSVDSATHQPVNGSSGSYHVTLDLVDSVTNKYQVTITGNNDGNPYNVSSPAVPKNGVDLFTFTFFDGANNQLTVRNDAGFQPTGSTNAYSGPANENHGVGGIAYGSSGGLWLTSVPNPTSSSSLQWSASSFFAGTDGAVAPHGGNSFTGTFYLASGQGPISYATVSLQDNGQQWSGMLTPEPGSLALLLPGLLPLGLVTRRRRSRR